MPCYDPPMPWEGKQRKNAETAVRLMCKYMSEAIKNPDLDLEQDILQCYIEHREIDLEIASSRFQSFPEDPETIKASIALAKSRLYPIPEKP